MVLSGKSERCSPNNRKPSNPGWYRVSIGLTFFIYLRAGRDIYKNHRQIKKFQISSSHGGTVDETMQSRKITEVSVTHEMANRNAIGLVDLERNNRAQERSGDSAPPRPPPHAYSVTISADAHRPPETADGDNLVRTTTVSGGMSGSANTGHRGKSRQNNNAIWHYTKCALFFFTALLVTWIPSSCNRVYSVVHHNQTVKVLEFMGAGVLPLQGFWNAVIYAVTSWKACKKFFGEDVKDWFSGDTDSGNRLRRDGGHHHSSSRVIIGQVASVGTNPFHKMGGRAGHASSETESMEELAACGSRRSSSYGVGNDSISKDVR